MHVPEVTHIYPFFDFCAEISIAAFDPIRGHFHLKQYQLSAKRYREQLRQRFED